MYISGGVTGGVSSVLSGGTFVDGARNGIIAAGLNHGMHLAADQWKPSYNRKNGKIEYTAEFGDDAKSLAKTLSISQAEADKLYGTMVDGKIGINAKNFLIGFDDPNNINCAACTAFSLSEFVIEPGFKVASFKGLLEARSPANSWMILNNELQSGFSFELNGFQALHTVVTFASPMVSGIDHFTTYLGSNRTGVPFVFTKEGYYSIPRVENLSTYRGPMGGGILSIFKR